jgi:catechol 2,3-dioxygenase-like lactoylglutathione lyase family enzyme
MLASGKLVGFVPTTDYHKTRAFYENKLGFEFVSLDQYALVMSVGGHKIRFTKIPNFAPLQGTILGWEVQDIERVATWLGDRGVLVEKYPLFKIVNSGSGQRPQVIGWRGSKILTATSFR